MSLINKVLRDLDARSTSRAHDPVAPGAVHQGLTPTADAFSSKRPGLMLYMFAVATVVIAYVAFSVMVTPLPFWNKMLIAAGYKQASVRVVITEAPIPDKKTEPVAKAMPVGSVKAEVNQEAKSDKIMPDPAIITAKREKIKTTAIAAKKPRARRTVSSRVGTIKKREKPVSNAEKAENAFRRGSIALEQGNRQLAEREFRHALTLNKKHTQTAELLAGVLISSGHVLDGIRVIEDTLKLAPKNTRLSNLLARLYVDQGQEHSAIAVLEKAQKQNPGSANLMSFRAVLYQRSGRHADAAKAYRNALTVVPGEGKWWVGLGISLEAQQDLPGAQTAYEKAQHTSLSPQLAQYAQQRLSAVKASK